jgi:hypothetical protein
LSCCPEAIRVDVSMSMKMRNAIRFCMVLLGQSSVHTSPFRAQPLGLHSKLEYRC